ncbi:MAG: hypothetical protein MKZ77_10325 [Acidimicrobiales bacterium]|nr:hypothetical protein [Acidimicrobiales bacterium]
MAEPQTDVTNWRPEVPPGPIRLSVGLETLNDLIRDQEKGFAAAGA